MTYKSSHKLYMIESRVFYELGRGFHTIKPAGKKTRTQKKNKSNHPKPFDNCYSHLRT